jgi:hypothetical protein
MKLRNKKTGEIIAFDAILPVKDVAGDSVAHLEYNSLAELNEEWEDAPEEPKEYWVVDYIECGVDKLKYCPEDHAQDDFNKQIGNYFETREEAEKAVEKLKAWKRLKDDGLKIREYELNGGTDRNGCFTGDICLTLDISKPVYEDILQLLFGGEQ